MKEMLKRLTQDHISDLPDSLLLYILCFLNMEEVVRTSVLSKRWQYIWTSIPTLTFVCPKANNEDEISKFVTRVNIALLHFQQISIEKFKIDSAYCRFTSEIDSWAQFAANKKVGDLSLHFGNLDGYYVLPQSVCCNSSLTKMSLCGCDMLDGSGISWPSLKSLSLECMDLCGNTIANVLCGCPTLEYLKIIDCWGFMSLDIESKTLREVVIASEEHTEITRLKILAPNLRFLHFYGHRDFICYHFQLEDVSSLGRATLNFLHPVSWDGNDVDNFMGIFKSICHVKELELGIDFIRCISQAMFLSGARALTSQLSCLTCLRLYLDRGKLEVPGLITLLKCSPNLVKLVVYSSWFCSDTPPELSIRAEKYWMFNKRIEYFPLPHLKTVKFLGFMGLEFADDYTMKLVRFLGMTILPELITTDGEELGDFD